MGTIISLLVEKFEHEKLEMRVFYIDKSIFGFLMYSVKKYAEVCLTAVGKVEEVLKTEKDIINSLNHHIVLDIFAQDIYLT